MNPNAGEIAALGTAMCYSASSVFFTQAAKNYGPLVSNRLRLIAAVLLLGSANFIIYGSPIPMNAELWRWLWLGGSGIIGLAIGDLFLFQAYVSIGPRMGLLFLSLSPAISTLLAWVFLKEALGFGSLAGIVITLGGIAWVVLEGSPNRQQDGSRGGNLRDKEFRKGMLCGVIAASGQSIGMVMAKNGLAGSFPALSGNLIRMMCAFAALWVVTIVQGQAVWTLQKANLHRNGMFYIALGSIFGPLIGVSLSLFSIQNTNIGIASTIIALPPIFLLPVSHYIFKERISWKAAAGTIVAILGVGLLFLV